MRIHAMVLLFAILPMFANRMAIATEPTPGHASLDSQPPQTTPRLTTIDPGPLLCECAPVTDSEWHWMKRRKVGLAVVGFGVLSGAVGLGFAWSAHRMVEANDFRSGQQAAAFQTQQVRERNLVAGTLFGVAALSALTGAALVLWPESKHVSVTVLPSGGALLMCGGAI
jgi:hypothetical protein